MIGITLAGFFVRVSRNTMGSTHSALIYFRFRLFVVVTMCPSLNSFSLPICAHAGKGHNKYICCLCSVWFFAHSSTFFSLNPSSHVIHIYKTTIIIIIFAMARIHSIVNNIENRVANSRAPVIIEVRIASIGVDRTRSALIDIQILFWPS